MAIGNVELMNFNSFKNTANEGKTIEKTGKFKEVKQAQKKRFNGSTIARAYSSPGVTASSNQWMN